VEDTYNIVESVSFAVNVKELMEKIEIQFKNIQFENNSIMQVEKWQNKDKNIWRKIKLKFLNFKK